MFLQCVLVTINLLIWPSCAVQCEPCLAAVGTLVHVRYNHTISLFGTANASDIPECSCDSYPIQCCHCEEDEFVCLSLDSALDYVNKLTQTTSISEFELTLGKNNNTNITLSASYNIHGLDKIVITGLGMATVYCDDGAGIIFNASMNVTIHSTSWWGCGPVAIPSSDEFGISISSGLAFINCVQVTILDTHFNRFHGSAVLFDIHYMPNSQCSSNSCPVSVYQQDKFYYAFENCSFVGNGRSTGYSNTSSEVKGGAVCILFAVSHPNSISIVNTQFESNEAIHGGAVFYDHSDLHLYDNCPDSLLSIRDSSFSGNAASGHGGALYMIGDEGFFDNCTFKNNSASIGGAIYYTLFNNAPLCNRPDQMNLVFQSCTWTGNKAQASAAFYFGVTLGTKLIDVVFRKSNFTGNAVSQFYFFDQSACVFYLSSIIAVLESIYAASNYGTALCLDTSNIVLKGNNLFVNNQGFQGGGIYIYTLSEIGLAVGQVLLFTNNTALYGGAVYQNVILPQSLVCIFYFQNETESSENNTLVKFETNTAFISGNSVYLVNATVACQETFNRTELVFYPKTNQVSSSAQVIEFLPPVYQYNGLDVVNVTLGISIPLNAFVLDFANQSALTIVNAFVQDEQNQAVPYTIVGSPAFTIENGTNSPNLSIKGPQVHEEFLSSYSLVLITANVKKSIRLYLLPCPLGLLYDSFTQKCICYSEDELVCNNETATVCIQDSYWLGESNGTYIVALCSFGMCSTAYGVCTECPIDGASSYCHLTGISSECLGNHTGILCGECLEGFAPGFQSIHCLNSSACNHESAFYMFAINAAFITAVLCLFVIILKLDYRIGSGYLFGVFYYYSIVIHLLPPNVVGEAMLITVAVLQEVTQLNPRLLSYIDLCYSVSNSAIVEYALCYLNCLILAISVFAIIQLSKYCTRFVVFSDSTTVRAICLLAISSFATLTEISFNIINPVVLEGTDQVQVNIQPSVKYLDLKDHLPWFVLSVLVILFVIIPFTLLLFMAPFLVRCINMNRIKPFLDQFQGCYKDSFRWMAGFYFLCRIVYLALLTSSGSGLKTTQYGVQFLSLIILLIHVTLQPYKSRFLNVIDSMILADLMILTLLFGQTANLVFVFSPVTRVVLTYILVLVPILYVLLLSTLALASKISKKYAVGDNCFFQTFKMPNTGSTEALGLYQSRSAFRDELEHYREPLLDLLESTEGSTTSLRRNSRPMTAQHRLFTELSNVNTAGNDVEIKKTQTVIERPTSDITESVVYNNSFNSSD